MKLRSLRFLSLLLPAVLTAGCGLSSSTQPPYPSGVFTLRHDGDTRSYLLRFPPDLPVNGGPLPLVIVLHGGGGNAENAENMTGFTPIARAERFIVVYPEGSARFGQLLTWNAGHCCGFAMQSRVDDVGFLNALIDELSGRYPVDSRRIYITGMSNGAMMAHRAGMELSRKVAAIAPVVGGIFGDEIPPDLPVSALIINGMLDRSVPYEGGPPGGFFSGAWDGTPVLPSILQPAFWADANGCASEPTLTDHPNYLHLRNSCPAPVGVEFYGVKGVGHAWPGGRLGSLLGDPPGQAFDASRVIWEFFAAHPKKER